MKSITVFRGDGIGPEITDVVLSTLKRITDLDFHVFDVQNGILPEDGLADFEKTKVLLKSPITTPIGKGFRSVNVQLRERYDLWANIRPAKSNPYLKGRYQDIDIVTFRENTEDLYIGQELSLDKDTYLAVKKITTLASTRIIQAAFDYALANNRKKVTCVHKANILKQTDGHFLSIFNQIKENYPIEANTMIVDNTCMQLVMNPHQFDILVMPNLYGDIVSDLTAGLIGGLGLLPSCNRNEKMAMFEAVHGSAPDIAGQNKANPTALYYSAILMLEHLGYTQTAKQLQACILSVYQDGTHLTQDVGGHASTQDFVSALHEKIGNYTW